jgi:hypothetical protein
MCRAKINSFYSAMSVFVFVFFFLLFTLEDQINPAGVMGWFSGFRGEGVYKCHVNVMLYIAAFQYGSKESRS